MQTPGEFVREQVTTVREKVDRVAGSVAETVASSVGEAPSVAAVSSQVGDFIREQRSAARVSLRELARTAGVSNPYLSQVERGLRKPSAEILASIARGLKISAETLYEQAGILDRRSGNPDTVAAIRSDERPVRAAQGGPARALRDLRARAPGRRRTELPPPRQLYEGVGMTTTQTVKQYGESVVARASPSRPDPVLAVVGAGDLAVERARTVVAQFRSQAEALPGEAQVQADLAVKEARTRATEAAGTARTTAHQFAVAVRPEAVRSTVDRPGRDRPDPGRQHPRGPGRARCRGRREPAPSARLPPDRAPRRVRRRRRRGHPRGRARGDAPRPSSTPPTR